MQVLTRGIIAGLLGVVCCGCASNDAGTGSAAGSGIELQPSDTAEVRYQAFSTGLDQSLRTANAAPPQANQNRVYAKVVATEAMRALIAALAAHGFFEHARPQAQADVRQARAALALRINGTTQIWVRRPADPTNIQELGAFNAALHEFEALFNQTYSYESAVGESGKEWIDSVQREASGAPSKPLRFIDRERDGGAPGQGAAGTGRGK